MVKRERDPESSTNAGPHPSSPTPSPSPSLSPGPVAKKRRTKPSTPTNAKGSTKWDAADLLALLEEVFDFAHAKMEVQPIATRLGMNKRSVREQPARNRANLRKLTLELVRAKKGA